MTLVLEARGISKRFHGTAALRDVDFTLEEGEVHALLGENGAGKSTLSKIFAGVVRPDAGEIQLRGKTVSIANPVAAQALGIGMVFQELDLFPHLSVAENMAAGNAAARNRFFVRTRELHDWCAGFLAQVGLEVNPGIQLRELSVGQVQLVAIARALSMHARVILMDEPTSSLSETNVEALFAVLEKLKRDGVSIVYVSHKMAEVQRIADRVTVLRDGVNVTTVGARDVSLDGLISLMVGRKVDQQRRTAATHGEVLLDIRSLQTEFLSNVSFQLRAGEVLGLAGLVGAGRSEVGAALFGLRDRTRIDATLNGKVFMPSSPADAVAEGLCLVPEERRTEALFPHMSPLDNTTIAVLPWMQKRGFMSRQLEEEAAQPLHRKLNLAGAVPGVAIADLSGGNQQKVIMARWLLANPKVLFLDEPTRGIDVGAKEQIYRIIEEFVAQGRAIIMVSSEMPELLRCCDRIVVMHEGRQAGIVDVASTSQEQILQLATGVSAAR